MPKVKREELTQSLLKEYIHYCPNTGDFTYIKKVSNKTVIGKKAGSISKRDGHLEIRFMGTLYRGNRLAWFYMTGEWGTFIDHKNHNELDNSWDNLRDVDRRTNNMNIPMKSNNTSGVMGVWYRKDTNKWVAEIMIDGKKHSLGCFTSLEEATRVRREAERTYGFYSNHGKV